MLARDYKDIVGGALLVIFGVAFVWHAAAHNEIGTLGRMGPGMFPMMLGGVLAAFGTTIAIQGCLRQGSLPQIRTLTPLFILGGIAAFALLIRPFGLIPAIIGATVISSMAELKFRPASLAVLSLALSVIAWLTFRVGLGLPLAMFRWPF